MHQDAWSKEIGEDGAPLWAIEPPPEKLLEGPLHDLGARRVSPQVTKAFESFFTRNTNNLQEKFAAMLAYVAGRFVGDPAVIGYEIFNEPQATDAELLPFHTKVAEAIRTVDKGHLIAFEPTVYRNFTNAATIADAPFPDRGGVYAPHVYTAVFNDDPRLAAGTFGPALQASWRGARDEANAWQTPLFVGELGVGPTTPNGAQWIDGSLDMADETLGSTAWWVWKEDSQGSWGMFDKSGTSWVERSDFIKMIARPHARAIGGDPVAMRWDGATLTIEVTVKNGVEPIHDVWWYPEKTPQALCNGDAVPLEPLGYNLYQARCTGTLTVK
jgi:endoglycosylceramidase